MSRLLLLLYAYPIQALGNQLPAVAVGPPHIVSNSIAPEGSRRGQPEALVVVAVILHMPYWLQKHKSPLLHFSQF